MNRKIFYQILKWFRYQGLIGYSFALIVLKIYRGSLYFLFDDKVFLKMAFFRFQGYKLNLDNPQNLNEKLQWLKLNDRRSLNTIFADKFLVRSYIAKHFGSEYLIPLLGTANNPRDLNMANLPSSPFIIKPNHSCGQYLIVRDKEEIDWRKAKIDFKWWLSFNFYYVGREYQYKNIRPMLVIEKLLLTKDSKIPNDFKLTCLNGKVEFIYVSLDREGRDERLVFDRNWIELPFEIVSRKFAGRPVPKSNVSLPQPSNLTLMIEFAERLAASFPYLRVDFYEVDDKLFFGEITHYHSGGFRQFNPSRYDKEFGDKMTLKSYVYED
jgi:hypothetical protein